MSARFLSATCLLAALAAGGCSQGVDPPETAPVEGTVLYKGQPVEGANVSFFTQGAPRNGYAITDSAGKFVVSTFGARDGAVLGEHVVTVSKAGETGPPVSSAQPPSTDELMKTYQEHRNKKPENKLPAKYANKDTSPLKFQVTKDAPNNFTLELVD